MPKRHRVGSVLGVCSALGFLATAGLHATGYSSVSTLARQAPEALRTLVPLLWVAFSADLVVVGLIVLVAAWRLTPLSAPVLALAGFLPAIAATLQAAYLGFIPPTAILIVLALATWASALALRITPSYQGTAA